MMRLKDKVCVVTGAGSGIGLATSMLFAENGCKAILCVDIDEEAAKEVASEIRETYERCDAIGVRADVSNDSDSKRVVDICKERYGRLDVYFANAGILGKQKDLEEATLADFRRHLDVNLIGPFLAIKYASEFMSRQDDGGSIICTASIAAIRADVTPLGYSCSKAGVVALVRSAQDMLITKNIRVNAVMPGGVMTAMSGEVAQRVAKDGMRVVGYDMDRFPPADPSEIAQVALFLASPESSFVRGQTIVADGGMSNSMGFTLRKIKKKKRSML